MFADGTQIGKASNDIEMIVKELGDDLTNLSIWIQVNKLSLCASKTEYKVHTTNVKSVTMTYQFKFQTRLLGVPLPLNQWVWWQIELLTKKENKILYVLKRLRDFLHAP